MARQLIIPDLSPDELDELQALIVEMGPGKLEVIKEDDSPPWIMILGCVALYLVGAATGALIAAQWYSAS